MNLEFRAKSKLNGKWHFGSYLNFGDDWCQIVPTQQHDDGVPDESIRVISNTVGIYSGINDVNKVKIFQGDIISCEEREPHPDNTLINRFEAALVDFEKGSFFIYPRCRTQAHHYLYNMRNVKVIGSIHDNPELFKLI